MTTADTATTPEASVSRGNPLLTPAIGIVFLALAVLFIADASSWFLAFLTIHVLFVVIWIGGGALLTLLGMLAERRNDPAELALIACQAAFVGERVFAPAGIVVVVMGVAMVENLGIGYGHFWVIFGLLGFLSTFLTGVAVLSPRAKRLSATVEQYGPHSPQAQAAISSILLIARADVALLLLVIVDMITKPFS
jgi:uncharacterized membrane protein